MPSDTGHSSAVGPAAGSRDRRITELTAALHSTNLLNAAMRQFAFDPARGMALELLQPGRRHPLMSGCVVYAHPQSHWYRVQVDGMGGTICCTLASVSSFLPVGPRNTTVLPPRSNVIVWVPPGQITGLILAAYPPTYHDSRLIVPDWLLQGSQSGGKRETVYTAPFKSFERDGGLVDFGASRPVDSTTLDWGRITELGSGLHLDAFLLFMRMSEICGLWLHYWDNYARLAGWNFDLQTAAHELAVRDDEGEVLLCEGHNIYSWEGLGLYAPGTQVHAEFDDVKVQYELPKGKLDLPDDAEDTQPIMRYQEYGGYLGQGRLRFVMIPAKIEGRRMDSDTEPDMGVFQESIGLDGSYVMRSARQLHLVKHVLIPVPKRVQRPEAQDKGDDARRDNYKFAGKFGAGDDHKIGDVQITGEHQHLRQAAGLLDILAYALDWRPGHPFHYHKEDYVLPQEGEIKNLPRGGAPERAQDNLDFSALARQANMDYPTAKSVEVDHRYSKVDYFQRTAGLSVLPDGSVVLFDGYGSTITLTGGHIRLDCPGDVQIMPGRNIVMLGGDDIVVRAKNSVDVTAGSKDLRLKGEKNVQVLSNTGGVLVESKAVGFAADFANKIGEDVVSGGVVLRAGRSAVVQWGGDIYLRTGSDEGESQAQLRKGQIVLDASKGDSNVILRGSAVTMFARSGVTAFVGPHDEVSDVQACYAFGAAGALLGKSTVINGSAVVAGGLLIDGGCISRSGFGAARGYPYVGKADAGKLSEAAGTARESVSKAQDAGAAAHEAVFSNWLYQSLQAGDDATISAAMFSFRDDEEQQQYNTQDFVLAESRWQTLARLQGEDAGKEWDEPTVAYQGREMLPWPGKSKWKDEQTLLRLKELTMFDAAAGRAKDRPDPFEDPKLSDWEPGTPAKDFKTIL